MSIRVYRLLRNNKEEGPFTAEELIQKNLRPYDLIWVDGRSAAWSYPGELAQFKNYAPLPGEENSDQNDKAQSAISPSVQAAMAINNNISQAKEKPRYKVSAAWSKIQTVTTAAVNTIKADSGKKNSPKKPMVVSHSTGIPSKSLSWEEAWQDWENQKDTGNEIHQPAPPKSLVNKKPVNKKSAEAVLETKYAEPLDSLKDKYIENILQQKQRGSKTVSAGKVGEFVLPAIALVVIFSAAYWLLNDTEVPALNTAAEKQVQAPPVINTTTAQAPAGNNAIKQEEIVTEEKKEAPVTATKAPEQAAERKSNKIHLYRAGSQGQIDKEGVETDNKSSAKITAPALKTANTKKAEMPPKVEANNTLVNNNSLPETAGSTTTDNAPGTTASSTNNTSSTSSQPTTGENKIKVPVKKVTGDYVQAPAFIEMSNGIANIKVKNISNIDFDLVVVDVQYYSASDSFKKGETIYLHNLKAGRNVVIKTPKDTSSAYATSKISLISSDARQLYVVGEN